MIFRIVYCTECDKLELPKEEVSNRIYDCPHCKKGKIKIAVIEEEKDELQTA